MIDDPAEWQWRSESRFIACPLRVEVGGEEGPHFTGGVPPHSRIACGQCGKPLTLLWDIDLTDPVLPWYLIKCFWPNKRLPLYICWQCVGASYSVKSDTEIHCHSFDRSHEYCDEDETPFADAPQILPRRPLKLTPVPSAVDGIVQLCKTLGWSRIDQDARRILNSYLQMSVLRSDVSFSQIGGSSRKYQGDRHAECPNPKCELNGQDESMRELAMIHWPEEPVLAHERFQLVYMVCIHCFALTGYYQCA